MTTHYYHALLHYYCISYCHYFPLLPNHYNTTFGDSITTHYSGMLYVVMKSLLLPWATWRCHASTQRAMCITHSKVIFWIRPLGAHQMLVIVPNEQRVLESLISETNTIRLIINLCKLENTLLAFIMNIIRAELNNHCNQSASGLWT